MDHSWNVAYNRCMRRFLSFLALVVLAGVVPYAYGAPFQLASSAFGPRESIPPRYTCDGADISPPLRWSGAPPGTRNFALIITDPDAPDPKHPLMTWIHWVVYNLPASTHELRPGKSLHLPAGTASGLNSWGKRGYGGPCPPIGRHRYVFRLYALDTHLGFDHPPSRAILLQAMHGHILAAARLTGLYAHKP